MKSNMIGLAGEFRVMSELLLRGHNPAKPYLEDGADLILENALKVEVKSAHLMPQEHARERYAPDHYKRTGQSMSAISRYQFKSSNSLQDYDYLICWCIDDDLFYIFPRELKLPKRTLSIFPSSKSKYNHYLGAWSLLEKGR
ncbi:hypothetical protein ES703_103928 [subsurface metagenome]